MLLFQYLYLENGTNGKRTGKLPFVFSQRKKEVCFPWSANGNRRLLFQQKYLCLSTYIYNVPDTPGSLLS